MRIRLGCELNYNFSVPTPMIVMLSVHYSRASDLEHPDHLRVDPSVPVFSYRDSFGNWCCRLVAPVGPFSLGTDTVIRDSGEPDFVDEYALQHPVEDLPA
ncbi:MAG: transglutaminase family protein, partial [Proteobacteria bacterium]